MGDLEKLKKDEIIARYKDLQKEYESLQGEYDDLDEAYGELESTHEYLKDDYEHLEKVLEDDEIEKLLKEIRFSTELQDKLQSALFKEYKDYFIGMVDLYCVDLPDEIYNLEIPKIAGMDDKIYKIVDDYVENFRRWN